MKQWIIRIILVAALLALGLWVWGVFFPSPEKIIRNRIGELGKAVSFSANEGELAKVYNASALGGFFTPDVRVTVEVYHSYHTINGRDDLLRAAMGARSTLSSLSVEFPDIKVTVDPDRTSAVVLLTAKGKVPGERDFYLQELRMRLTKVKRAWLINQVETVKTLS